MKREISAPIHSSDAFEKYTPNGHSQHISGPKFKALTVISSV